MSNKRKIVFVLGAGTGFDIDMPLGDGLRTDIRRALSTHTQPLLDTIDAEQAIRSALLEHTRRRDNDFSDEQMLSACRHISDSMSLVDSIDECIDIHRGNEALELCAKVAIVDCIISAEERCGLNKHLVYTSRSIGTEALEDTWFRRLLSIICGQGVQFGTLKSRLEQFVFVNFNYDRCLETYLYETLQVLYKKSGEEVADALSSLTILHPYGCVASLPWQVSHASEPLGFGDVGAKGRLIELSRNIRTFAEQKQDQALIYNVKEEIANAGMIVFLGFAFHEMNMDLLLPQSSGSKFVYGTGIGLKEDEAIMVRELLSSVFDKNRKNNVIIKNVDCSGLLREYQRRILSVYGNRFIQFPGS